MKVLYVGVYRDGTGWGHAATDYILSLDAAGVDVVPRPIKLNDANFPVNERVLELEQKSHSGCDVVIQHILPHLMDYNSNFAKNIGMYATETSRFDGSNWPKMINFMDEAWVFNAQSKQASLDSGVNIPIKVLPHATDIEKFQRSYEPFPFRETLKDDFIFYFIGEANHRKNLSGLLKAFHLEFGIDEPVQLLIKTTGTEEQVRDYCNEVKVGIKAYPRIDKYKPEIICTEKMSETDIMRLHASCNCFVMPSYGEAWCIPAFDAMAMGNTPIVSDSTGFKEYIGEGGWLVPTREEPCFGMINTFSDLYTGRESWYSPDILQLRKAMREAYENTELRNKKAKAGIEQAYNFTYAKVGLKMKEYLGV